MNLENFIPDSTPEVPAPKIFALLEFILG